MRPSRCPSERQGPHHIRRKKQKQPGIQQQKLSRAPHKRQNKDRDAIDHQRATAPTATPPRTIATARLAPELHMGVSARAAPVVGEVDAPEDAADDAADARDESADEATERAEDAAEEAAAEMDEAAEEREFETFEAEAEAPGAVAVPDVPEALPVRVADADGAADAAAPTVKEGLVARTSVVLDALMKLTTYDPGEMTSGKRTVILLSCGFTVLAIARPPANVWLLPSLKIASVSGVLSEESEDQVMVALDPGVGELSCKFDTAVAVAANARATMAERRA
jgi:hypothetical protein